MQCRSANSYSARFAPLHFRGRIDPVDSPPGGRNVGAAFKPDETFRNDFTFRNSPEAIRRFPLPFHEDEYMYSVNIEPHLPSLKGSGTEFAFGVDEHYAAQRRKPAIGLAAEPCRFQALPHTRRAMWT